MASSTEALCAACSWVSWQVRLRASGAKASAVGPYQRFQLQPKGFSPGVQCLNVRFHDGILFCRWSGSPPCRSSATPAAPTSAATARPPPGVGVHSIEGKGTIVPRAFPTANGWRRLSGVCTPSRSGRAALVLKTLSAWPSRDGRSLSLKGKPLGQHVHPRLIGGDGRVVGLLPSSAQHQQGLARRW